MTGDHGVLIKGGRVLSLSQAADDAEPRDILIKGGEIVRVAPDLPVSDAQVIDATGCIVHPGFIDTHRHTWQTQLRTVASDWSLFDYIADMRCVFSSLYTAEDAYLGNYVGALEAVNAGITTLVDHCHIVNSPDHAEEAVRGLEESGVRSLFCYGFWPNPTALDPLTVAPGEAWRFETAARLRQGRLASDTGRVLFGVAPAELEAMPWDLTVAEIGAARQLGAHGISMHVAMGAYDNGQRYVEKLHAAGLLADDMLFVHGSALTDGELDLLRESGAGLSATPETELQMGMGIPVVARALKAGVATSLGVDIVSNYSGDMFSQMRLMLQTMRAQNNLDLQKQGRAPRVITPKAADLLRVATVGGAQAIGLADRIGTIEAGKKADIVITRTDALHMTPSIDAVGALVLQANVGDVDTVIVDGRILKRHGKLVNVDWPAVSQRLRQSAARLIDQGRRVDATPIRQFVGGLFNNLA